MRIVYKGNYIRMMCGEIGLVELNAGLTAVMIFQGIRTIVAKEPYIFETVHWGVRTPCPPPPLGPRMLV